MRKLTLFTILVFISFLVISSCNKANEENENPDQVQTMNYSVNLVYYDFGVDITEDDFLKNPDDMADEKFNYVEYAMNLGLLEIYLNHPAIFSQMLTKASGTVNNMYDLLDYSIENNAINPIFDSIFSARFNDFNTYANWQDYVAEHYVYDTTYVPFIYIMNTNQVNTSLPAYVSMYYEIDEEKFPQFDDNIPTWIKSQNNLLFTTLNAKDVWVTENPILTITNGHKGDATRDFVKITETPFFIPEIVLPLSCGDPIHFHENLNLTSFKINERYEGTGKSEFEFVSIAYVGYAPTLGTWEANANVSPYFLTSFERKFEQKVSKSEVGSTTFTVDRHIYTPHRFPDAGVLYPFGLCFDIMQTTPSINEHFLLFAYEYDFGRSRKLSGKAKNKAGTTHEFGGRRKYDDEWYYFTPSSNNSYDFKGKHPSTNTQYTNNTKGQLKIDRWH